MFGVKSSTFLILLFIAKVYAVEGVPPEVAELARQRVAYETKIRDEINGLTREEFRSLVNTDAGEVVSRIGEGQATKIRNLVSGYQNLSRQVGLSEEFTNEEMLTTFFPSGASSPEKPSDDKKTSEKAEPEKKADAEKKAEERAAKKAAEGRDAIRRLENEFARQFPDPQQGGNQRGKGSSGGGQESSNNSNSGFPGFPPQSNNNGDSPNQVNSGFDRLANRLSNLGNQGFSGFSQSQNPSKKEEDKKSNFTLPESKKSSWDEPASNMKAKTSSGLPQLQTGDQNFDLGKSQPSEMQGTPLQPAPPVESQSMSGLKNGSSAFSNGAAGNQPLMGGMMGGQMAGNQAMMGSLGQDFPFNITGEPYDPESELDQFPRYRVYDVSMGGSSASGGESSSGLGDAGLSNELSIQNSKKVTASQILYFMTPDEQSLKEVPGIFRGLAAGYKKSRIQLLCSFKDRRKIGLCEKVRKDSDI